ncbi:MAG TPA: prepilin-type N-terminal cleavage/methylation domain-containing protein [Blastocatellia bacterium]|nr:prepilin-type N-terminal cleavage/methylation domain-containing protein [Blastocatellia bacterium]
MRFWILDFGFWIRGKNPRAAIQNLKSKIQNPDGFTLLELVMVMTIIVVIAAIAVTSYQNIHQKAKEEILKQNLRELRKKIDEYAADKERLPSSLDDLATAGYIREVPIDPVTGEADWVMEMGEDTVAREGGQGVVDVRSNAAGAGRDGKAYRDY